MAIDTIPALNHEGLLPPFLGDPARNSGLSPYRTNLTDLIQTFGISERRLEIITGFVRYRRRLFQVGIKKGFQWVNGSFCQGLEREPGDIDVVTIFHSSLERINFASMVNYNKSLFDKNKARASYDTDAYYVDAAALDYYQFTRRVSYWFGLFSHTRQGSIWKGILEIPLPNSHDECDAGLALITKKQEAFHG